MSNKRTTETTGLEWRVAFQIAPQLPEDREQAWGVLGRLAVLIDLSHGLLDVPMSQAGVKNQLVVFEGGSKMPNRRASSSDNPPSRPK